MNITESTKITLTIGQLKRLIESSDSMYWPAQNCLPDIRIGRLVPSLGRMKEMAIDFCKKWCANGLRDVSDEDLDAAIKGRKIKEWQDFVRDCNIPTSKNITSWEIYECAWECFQEQCLDELMGVHLKTEC